MTGIEPAYSAWEAISRPERPFYTGWSSGLLANSNTKGTCGFGPVGTRLPYGSGSGAVRSRPGYGRGTARPFGEPLRLARIGPSSVLESVQCRFESDWGHGVSPGRWLAGLARGRGTGLLSRRRRGAWRGDGGEAVAL